ncbi:MAG TPA: hypothetical protein VKU02_29155, partial [Gemmataceae bacterium]|nr:hypothetical protein [Gemmataceae bacterium]
RRVAGGSWRSRWFFPPLTTRHPPPTILYARVSVLRRPGNLCLWERLYQKLREDGLVKLIGI